MKTTTGHRLKEIMFKNGLRQVDVLEKCKPYCEKYGIEIRRGDLSQYVSDKVKPNQHRLTILALALGVSEPYLMGYDEDDKDEEVYNLFRSLSTADKMVVKTLIDSLLKRANGE